MNMAFYNMLFDRASDEFYELIGLGATYAKTRGHTSYTAEFHICYVRELHLGDRVRVHSWLLDHDDKRFHSFQEIHHEDGWLAATGEALACISTCRGRGWRRFRPISRRGWTPLPRPHGHPDKPERAGRAIGIPRR